MPTYGSDAEALEAIRGGNAHAFRHFLAAYKGAVERIVAGHVPRSAVADVAQEAFIRAYNSLDGYDPGRPFANWMSTLALRACYDHLRSVYANRERTFSELSPEGSEWLEGVVDRASVETYARDREKDAAGEALAWALERLPPLERMVLTLTALEGRSVEEAADLLEMSAVNVRVRAHRARKKLRTLLEKEMGT
jgi:RNA polymerase sigma-70 factor (ECF subfamily)